MECIARFAFWQNGSPSIAENGLKRVGGSERGREEVMSLDLVPQQQRRGMHRCERQFHKTGRTERNIGSRGQEREADLRMSLKSLVCWRFGCCDYCVG